jgi:tetratricopeptide (TPR) repeat protein
LARSHRSVRRGTATIVHLILGAALSVSAAAATAHLPISTSVPAAQQAFDRGLFLYYAYDGPDAVSAFAEAGARDPHLAMAYWGEALAQGPDLNTPMTAERFAAGRDAIARAVALEGGASIGERAYIDALAQRYGGTWDRWTADDARYRTAAVALASRSRDNVAMDLAAEALLEHGGMVWKAAESAPATPDAAKALQLIDGVLADDPSDPMANHLCIHAYDDAPDRSPALACAQRLDAASFPPQAEHLAHMPAHYWIETGAYGKAVASSERAYRALVELDRIMQRTIAQERYGSHDVSVGYTAAMMLGNYALAQVWASRYDAFYEWTYDALTALRFGRYEQAAASRSTTTFDLPVRGLALLHLGRTAEARAVADRMLRTIGTPSKGYLPELFLARLAEAGGDDAHARSWLDLAIANQHAYFSGEIVPEIPAEEALGGYLLRRRRFAQAAQAFSDALAAYPNDPRARFGLSLALERQGRTAEAAQGRQLFEAAWAGADTTLTIDDL